MSKEGVPARTQSTSMKKLMNFSSSKEGTQDFLAGNNWRDQTKECRDSLDVKRMLLSCSPPIRFFVFQNNSCKVVDNSVLI